MLTWLPALTCGASFINQKYKDYLHSRLKNKTYLETNGETIQSIIEAKVIEFENGRKRLLDTTRENLPIETVCIHGLKENRKKGYRQNRLIIKQ